MSKFKFFFVGCIALFVSCTEDEIEDRIQSEDIEIEAFLNGPIIFESNDVTIDIDKEGVAFDSLQVYLNDEIILNQKTNSAISFRFDPDSYPTGESIIKVDVFQNGVIATSKQYPITIHRKLLEVELDDQFFQPGNQDGFVFASAHDGTLLTSEKVESTPTAFTLTTEIDIDKEDSYLLTTVSRYVDTAIEIVYFNSVDDLTRSSFEKFTPNPERRRDIDNQQELATSGFDGNLIINGMNTPGYSYGYDHIDFSFFLTEYNSSNSVLDYERFYIRAQDIDSGEHTYMWLNKDELTDGFVLNADNLTNENLVSGSIDVSYVDEYENGHYRSIEISGYLNENDFQSHNYHSIWLSGRGTQQSPDMFINPTETYVLNTSFYKYSHFLELEDYITNRLGTPIEQYDIPDWGIDFNASNKQIGIIASGTGHNVGRILVSSGNITDELPIIEGKKVLYIWNLNFDSVNTTSVVLPELPDEIANWSFGKFYESSEPTVKWVRLERYEGIIDYQQYLDDIIKDNNIPLLVSPIFEAKFKSIDDFNSFNSNPVRFFY